MEVDYDYWWRNQWRLEAYSNLASISSKYNCKVPGDTVLKIK